VTSVVAASVPLARRRRRWAAVLVVAAAILLASVVDPGRGAAAPGPLGVVSLATWGHLLGYAALAGAVAAALAGRPVRTAVAVAVVAAVAYGAGIELLQSVIPARSFDPADAVANAAGAAVGVGAWRALAATVGNRRAAGADPASPETGPVADGNGDDRE
jgi:VanZ family protein